MGQAGRRDRRPSAITAARSRRCSTAAYAPSTTCGARVSTWWSARAPAARPRSTCARNDFVNMGLARRARAARASWSATSTGAGCSPRCTARVALLPPADQALVAGFVVNKFRGDARCSQPGLDMLARAHRAAGARRAAVAARACGWTPRTRCGLARTRAGAAPPDGADVLRVAVVAAPADLQLHRRGRAGRRARRRRRGSPTGPRSWPTPTWWCCPAPGRRWPTWAGCASAGWTTRWSRRAAAGRPVLGICGGYQMLGRGHRPGRGRAPAGAVDRASGCCPCGSRFAAEKALGRPTGDGARASRSTATRSTTASRRRSTRRRRAVPGRLPRGRGWGTIGTGSLENDGFRRAFLARVAADAGRPDWRRLRTRVRGPREARLDGHWPTRVEEHLDTAALLRIITGGPERASADAQQTPGPPSRCSVGEGQGPEPVEQARR